MSKPTLTSLSEDIISLEKNGIQISSKVDHAINRLEGLNVRLFRLESGGAALALAIIFLLVGVFLKL